MNLIIRKVESGDEALFDWIAEEVFDEPVDTGRLRAFLREPGHHLVVAIVEGEIVGHVAAMEHRHLDRPTDLYVDEVAVAPHFQRRGLAQAMLEEMMRVAASAGCIETWVATELDNLPARALYASLGLTEQQVALFSGECERVGEGLSRR